MEKRRRWRWGIFVLAVLVFLCLYEIRRHLLAEDIEGAAWLAILVGLGVAMAARAAFCIYKKH